MKRSERAAVAFGSNLGSRREHIRRALNAIRNLPDTRLLQRSELHDTEPVGGPPQGRFLNGVVTLETSLSAIELLDALLAIERAEGRQRTGKDHPRTIDLDLILFGNQVVDRDRLQVPHPRAHQREFVLQPLAEVAAAWKHPVLGKTVGDLYKQWKRNHRK